MKPSGRWHYVSHARLWWGCDSELLSGVLQWTIPLLRQPNDYCKGMEHYSHSGTKEVKALWEEIFQFPSRPKGCSALGAVQAGVALLNGCAEVQAGGHAPSCAQTYDMKRGCQFSWAIALPHGSRLYVWREHSPGKLNVPRTLNCLEEFWEEYVEKRLWKVHSLKGADAPEQMEPEWERCGSFSASFVG